jgi:hypothetical protein
LVDLNNKMTIDNKKMLIWLIVNLDMLKSTCSIRFNGQINKCCNLIFLTNFSNKKKPWFVVEVLACQNIQLKWNLVNNNRWKTYRILKTSPQTTSIINHIFMFTKNINFHYEKLYSQKLHYLTPTTLKQIICNFF